MAKTAQVLSDLNETLFAFAVNFLVYGSSLAQSSNLRFGGVWLFSQDIYIRTFIPL
jgi:hypothetical protein